MRFLVLGPVGVVASGRKVRLARGQQRTILALLLAGNGEVVTTDRLVDAAGAARLHRPRHRLADARPRPDLGPLSLRDRTRENPTTEETTMSTMTHESLNGVNVAQLTGTIGAIQKVRG